MAILKSIALDEANDGGGELIALSLEITSADASPVRAVLSDLA